MAAGLAFVVAGAAIFLWRPALIHALWILVLLKLITPPLLGVPISGYAGSLASEGRHRLEETGKVTLVETSPAATVPRSTASPSSASPSAADPHPPGADLSPLAAFLDRLRNLWNIGAFRIREVCFGIAVVGSILWFIGAGIRIRRFRRLLSSACPASGELVAQVQRCAARLGLARCPHVLVLPVAVSPLVCGIGRRTRLVLPQDLLDELDPAQLATVVTHELAHLRRGDQWVRLLELVVTGLYWWHPVVWWARRELQRTEEEACDAWVVWASPEAAPTYANALLRTMDYLSKTRGLLSPLASGMGRVTLFKRRLAMIMSEEIVPQVLSGRGRLALLALAAVFLPFTLVWAGATDVPSLEEITAGLQQRHDKIQSLYVETVGETSSPFGSDELTRLPDNPKFYRSLPGRKIEYHYAVKGEKRYSRKKRDEAGIFRDEMRAYDGTAVWDRRETKTVHPDGKVEKDGPTVGILPLAGHARFVYPTEWFAMNVGVAVAGPDLAAEYPWQDLFYYDPPNMPDAQEHWTFTVSDETEEVDGAECAVLSGTIELTSEPDKSGERHLRQVRFWLDLERGLALRKWEQTFAPGKKPLCRVVNSAFVEVKPALWLPQATELQIIAPAENEAVPEQFRGKLILLNRIKVTKCLVGEVPDDVFDPLVKEGDRVHDLRGSGRPRQPSKPGYDKESFVRLGKRIGIGANSDKPDVRVLEVRVRAGSPAEKAGIRTGDRITAINSRTVKQFKDIVTLLPQLPLDKGVRLSLLREGKQTEAKLPGDLFRDFSPASGQRR